MELQNIDKACFKKHLNRFQGGLVVALLLLSLGLSELYVGLWSDGGSHFWLNAAAVATAAFIIAGVVGLVKNHPALTEVMYVWRLKNELNRIYRASRKLDKALADNNPDALAIKYYQLHASRHLYQLEDNTLTLDELNQQITDFDQKLAELGLTLSIGDYQPDLLNRL
ncbi:DUF3087 family protein [Venatoribacter cucullus]|uniref:DUF3087 family protein n=1 Tax=Venatoribacter cucullus TaxID=2661630 RepID=UPI00223EE1EE|nr:DUF3087 family protein [Venatoribacter cucullus]UZK03098.1 DUF3087 family protein [Venatoribacter cucullus]